MSKTSLCDMQTIFKYKDIRFMYKDIRYEYDCWWEGNGYLEIYYIGDKKFSNEEDLKRYIDKTIQREKKLKRLRVV